MSTEACASSSAPGQPRPNATRSTACSPEFEPTQTRPEVESTDAPWPASLAGQQRPRGQPATTAHRHQADCTADAFQFVDGLGEKHTAGASERVTHRDGPAIRIDPLVIR